MTRPNAALLGAFLIAATAVLAGAGLTGGGLDVGRFDGDTLHLMDIVLREARGQWPHLDFRSPIGLLATAPIAFFVSLGAGFGHAFLYAQAMVAVLCLPAIWWVSASRFRAGWRYVFGALVLVMILALVHAETSPVLTISMHYNRWAWALSFLAIATALLPTRGGHKSQVADGLVIGAALSLVALIKITFFAVFLLPIALALVARGAWRAALMALATGAVVALLVTLASGTPMFWLAYIRDILWVIGSEVRPNPGRPFKDVVGAPAYLGGSILAIASVILLRQAGRKLEGLVLLLLVPGFFYVTYQNFGNDPQWLWLLGPLLLALRPEAETRGAFGLEARQSLLIAGVAALALASPSITNLFLSPFTHFSIDRTGAGTGAPRYVPLVPGSGVHEDLRISRGRADRVDFGVAADTEGAPFFGEGDLGLRRDLVEFAGESWPACTIDVGMQTWSEVIAEDLKASGLVTDKTLLSADIVSPFWLYGAGEPLPGGAPWYYGGLTGWAAADFLLVPFCPVSTKLRKRVLDEVTEAGTALTEVRRTAHYVLYEK